MTDWRKRLTEKEKARLTSAELKALEIYQSMPGSVHACPPWILRTVARLREIGEAKDKALQAWFDWENDGTGQADTTDYDEEGAEHLQLMMVDTRAALALTEKMEDE